MTTLQRIKARRKNMGSVISGTMRPEDLLPAFIDTVRGQRPLNREHSKDVTEIQRRIDRHYRKPEKSDYFIFDSADDDIERLFDILTEYCPQGFYFGAHPGDGADYGFWLSETFIEDFDGLQVSDTSEVPKNYRGDVLHVNDHGNATLYWATRGKLVEQWSIV
jgi:hypothetical protein